MFFIGKYTIYLHQFSWKLTYILTATFVTNNKDTSDPHATLKDLEAHFLKNKYYMDKNCDSLIQMNHEIYSLGYISHFFLIFSFSLFFFSFVVKSLPKCIFPGISSILGYQFNLLTYFLLFINYCCVWVLCCSLGDQQVALL